MSFANKKKPPKTCRPVNNFPYGWKCFKYFQPNISYKHCEVYVQYCFVFQSLNFMTSPTNNKVL